jgi:hypothetical protein
MHRCVIRKNVRHESQCSRQGWVINGESLQCHADVDKSAGRIRKISQDCIVTLSGLHLASVGEAMTIAHQAPAVRGDQG